jgi:hypothetical protein
MKQQQNKACQTKKNSNFPKQNKTGYETNAEHKKKQTTHATLRVRHDILLRGLALGQGRRDRAPGLRDIERAPRLLVRLQGIAWRHWIVLFGHRPQAVAKGQ